MSSNPLYQNIFVTVGTTLFNELIDSVLDKDTIKFLEEKGCTNLTLQYGRGEEPVCPMKTSINISCFNLKTSISADIKSASLVISHAGAGSCLEALDEGKPLIVVVNQRLMNNHQMELADKLQTQGHVSTCYSNTILVTLKELETLRLTTFPSRNTHSFSNFLENFMGVE